MGDIRVQRGNTTLAAGVQSLTIPISLATGDANKAFVRLTSAGPSNAVSQSGQPLILSSDDYAGFVTLTNATTITIDAGTSTAVSKVFAWELWEYIGVPGGANEFLVRDQGTAVVSSIVSNDTANPFPMTVSRDVFVFARGGFFSGGTAGAGDFPSELNSLGFCFTLLGTNFLRFFRGSNDPNNVWNAEYSAVEFVGSNWTTAFGSGTPVFAGFLLPLFLDKDINDWSKSFIWAQKRTAGNNCNDQGLVALPDASTGTINVKYAVGANITTGFSANSFYLMVLNNPFMTVETRSSVDGSGIAFPSTVSAVTQTIDEPTAGISGNVNEAAVLGSAYNDLNFPAFPIGLYTFRVLNSTTVRWFTSDGRFIEDWAQYVIDFSGLGFQGEIVEFDVKVKPGLLEAVVSDPVLEAVVSDPEIDAAVSTPSIDATEAAATIDATVAGASIDVTLPVGLLGSAPEDC